MIEEWRECLRFKNDYMPESTYAVVLISNNGIAKKLEHKIWNKKNGCYSIIKEKIYKPQTNRGKQRLENNDRKEEDGLYVSYCINNKTYLAHRLVADAFIPNLENKPHINHINEKRNDNRVENLEWVTNLENQQKMSKYKKERKKQNLTILSDDNAKYALKMRLKGLSTIEIGGILNTSYETIRLRTLEIATNEEKKEIKRISKIISRNNRLKTMKDKGLISAYSISCL